MKTGIVLFAVIAAGVSLAAAEENKDMGVYAFKVKDINGEVVDLSRYKGKVAMVVNVASRCGLTPQYEALNAVYKQYADKGFAVLGFPANNFMGQEPGTNEEIKFFCETKYDVAFDIFAKISVKGDDIAPLYAYLTSKESNPGFSGTIKWNFSKFLVDREGKVIARFAPTTKPDSKKVIAAIESALAGKDPSKEDSDKEEEEQ